jgi:adenine-specific DNA-methyltransferase
VLAIDTDPLATLMTRTLLAILRAGRARVLCGDYISASIPRIAGKTAFVGNPPYVRHHDIAPNVKRHIDTLAADAAVSRTGLAGLHVWFFVATYARHGVPGDVGAFVTSAQWLDATYGRVLRELLSGPMGGRSILTFDSASSPFDAMTTAAIATFEIGARKASVLVGTTPAPAAAIELERIGCAVPTEQMRASSRWSQIAAGAPGDPASTIGSLFRVSRGQVTGANAFFVMSHHSACERGIETFCIPVISAAREILTSGGVVTNGPLRRVALCVPPHLDLCGAPALARYIAAGEAAGIHRRYVPSHRKPWYAVAYSRPPMVSTYMARRPPYFATNPDGLAVLNIAHGLFPRTPMNCDALRDAVERLNATGAQFAGRGRTYHGGLQKFEPGDLAALPLEGLKN